MDAGTHVTRIEGTRAVEENRTGRDVPMEGKTQPWPLFVKSGVGDSILFAVGEYTLPRLSAKIFSIPFLRAVETVLKSI